MQIYHTASTEARLLALDAQYSLLLGLPNQSGTTRWAIPRKALNQDLWFIEKLPPEGWGNDGNRYLPDVVLPQLDLTGIVDMPFDEAWITEEQ